LRSILLWSVVVAATAAPLAGQAARELQVHALGSFASKRFLGGGVGFAFRNQARTRVGFSVSVGDFSVMPADGGGRTHALGGRAEALLSYHVSPYERTGFAPYAGGGVAVAATADDLSEYLLIVIGVETAPGGRRGWFAELGLGGGARMSAGFRVRWR